VRSIEDIDGEGHVRGHLDLHRAVRLNRRVAQDFPHAHAGGTEGGGVDLAHGLVGDFHGLFDAHEARRPGIEGSPAGDRLGGDTGDGRVGAVEVVHAADVQRPT
jgi:hypothetical protein